MQEYVSLVLSPDEPEMLAPATVQLVYAGFSAADTAASVFSWFSRSSVRIAVNDTSTSTHRTVSTGPARVMVRSTILLEVTVTSEASETSDVPLEIFILAALTICEVLPYDMLLLGVTVSKTYRYIPLCHDYSMGITRVATKTVPIADIVYDSANPNRMTDEQKAALAKTIRQYGYAQPVWVRKRPDGKYDVIDGEHRARFMQEAGEASLPVAIFDVSDADIRILRQVANKLKGRHDRTADAEEFQRIFADGKLDSFASLLGEHSDTFRSVLERSSRSTVPESADYVPERPEEEPVSAKGQSYRLGDHTLHCGDCRDVLPTLPKAELLLTDPPYGISVISTKTNTFHSLPTVGNMLGKPIIRTKHKPIIDDDIDFDPSHLLAYGKVQIIFGANHYHDKLPLGHHWLVWDKKQQSGASDTFTSSDCELMWTNLNGVSVKIYRHLWDGVSRAGERVAELTTRVHPTQKPVGLLEQLIRDHSRPGDTVLDPYMGSGSTLIAAERTGRVCIGVEIDPYYVDVIVSRWEKITEKKAELI